MTEEYAEVAGEEDLDAQLDQQQDGATGATPEDLSSQQAVSELENAAWLRYICLSRDAARYQLQLQPSMLKPPSRRNC